jgi:hypothetical protein
MTYIDLIFLVPLTIAVLYLVIGVSMGGLDAGDADVDLDIDPEIDLDIGDVDADAAVETPAVTVGHLASFTGFGKIPVTLWVGTFFILWGTAGMLALMWIVNMPIRLAIAAVVAFVGTKLTSVLIAKVAPQKCESDLVSYKDRLGLIGKVITSKVDTKFGQGVFETKGGRVFWQIRIRAGESVLPQNTKVIITGVRPTEGVSLVQTEESLLAQS